MNYDDIKATINNLYNDYTSGITKGDAIDLYEELDYIKVVDSAYPNEWDKSVRREYGIRNIGMWAWAYNANSVSFPVPCDIRALALFDVMLGTDSHLLIREKYETNYSITYETPEGEVKRTGTTAISESDAIARFAKRSLGVVRAIDPLNTGEAL